MTDDNVQRAIGQLEGAVRALSAATEINHREASESRKALYERLGKVETSIQISGQIDAQVRESLNNIKARIESDIMPTINEVKNWKITGITIIAMVGVGGAAVGAFVLWAWDIVVAKLHL